MTLERADRPDPFGLIGKTVGGKYRVEAVVEETGLSVVYRASHRVWRRPVAIKAFKAQSLDDNARSQLLESFVREGALLAELSERTAAVCQARDVASLVTERGEWVPYMVLEWLDGESLDAILERERADGTPPRTVERALRILAPVARALSLAHDRGIVHCDVKPGNICVLKDAAVGGTTPTKLYDFGIATSLRNEANGENNQSAARLSAFSPGYAAPEQYSVEYGAIGPWTDVHALALVFLELVTGKEPLAGDTVEELRRRACDPEARPTPRTHRVHVGNSVERVLAKALALRPEDRFAHADDFWTALTRAAKDRLKDGTIPFMLVRPPRSAPRRRWVLPAVAIGGGAAALAALSHWAQLSQAMTFLH
jgi:eukaryotic-like serine/threonine-protein kinase